MTPFNHTVIQSVFYIIYKNEVQPNQQEWFDPVQKINSMRPSFYVVAEVENTQE